MKTITSTELDAICKNGQPIDSKGGYPAVVLHPDGTITKLWARKKGLFSSSTLSPYSTRFVKNANELAKRGITVPEITNHAKVEKSHVRLVTYRALPGTSIRELIQSAPQEIKLTELCRYIDTLHQKGILFGGMHLGNIIQMPDGYGLIDFTDVKFFNRPLSIQQRATNLRTPLRYHKDIEGLPEFLETYLTVANLSSDERQQIRSNLTG